MQAKEVRAERRTIYELFGLSAAFFPSRKCYIIDSANTMHFVSNIIQSSHYQGKINMITKSSYILPFYGIVIKWHVNFGN